MLYSTPPTHWSTVRSKSDRLVKCQLGALIFLIYEFVTGEHRTGEDRSFMMQGKQDGNPVGLDWSDRPPLPYLTYLP